MKRPNESTSLNSRKKPKQEVSTYPSLLQDVCPQIFAFIWNSPLPDYRTLLKLQLVCSSFNNLITERWFPQDLGPHQFSKPWPIILLGSKRLKHCAILPERDKKLLSNALTHLSNFSQEFPLLLQPPVIRSLFILLEFGISPHPIIKTMSNLYDPSKVINSPQPMLRIKLDKILAHVPKMICGSEDESLAALKILSLVIGDESSIRAVIESGVSRRIAELLSHPNKSIRFHALIVESQLVTGDDIQTQIQIDGGLINALPTLFDEEDIKFKLAVSYTASNIAAGNRSQIRALLKSNTPLKMIYLLEHDEFNKNDVLVLDILWTFANISTYGGTEILKELMDLDVIRIFSSLLERIGGFFVKGICQIVECFYGLVKGLVLNLRGEDREFFLDVLNAEFKRYKIFEISQKVETDELVINDFLECFDSDGLLKSDLGC